MELIVVTHQFLLLELNNIYVKKILFFFSSLSFLNIIYGQCLNDSEKLGYFDEAQISSQWLLGSSGEFSIENGDYYYGSGSLKVVSPSNNDENVKILTNEDCLFQTTSNQQWNISLYIKGVVGDLIEFSIVDNEKGDTNIGSIEHKIIYKGWHYVRLNFTTNSSTEKAKFKINFKSKTTYWIDNLVLNNGHFNEWYVDDDGSDNNNGKIDSPFKTLKKAISNNDCVPGDIIYVRSGSYNNINYGTGNKSNSSVVNINSNYNGSINFPRIIRNFPGESPKINFDGSGAFIIGTTNNPVNHLEIAGFEIQGPNQNISYNEAKEWRDSYSTNSTQSLKNYYHGRGIAIWGGTYINIHNNKVHDCPNSGIRANNSDYMRVSFNEVFNNTWWSFNAESAIVFAQSKSIDSDLKIKMRIENNLVYNNMNRLPFYSKNKPCNTSNRYGCADQDNIIDGSGSYITRNNDDGIEPREDDENPNGQYVGRFYFANNINYGNGINGLVVHKTDNAVVTNNLAYINGAVPTNAELNDIASNTDAPAWKKALKSGRQDTSGIVVHTSANVKLHNNITWAKFSNEWAFQTFGTISNLEKRRNLIGNGKGRFSAENPNGTIAYYEADPNFTDAENYNFRLKNDSPAINKGENNSFNPSFDYDYNFRNDNSIDIGPFEYINNNNSDNDSDGDGIVDSVDNCPNTSNPGQEDYNNDNIGDSCDESDIDADGVVFYQDNSPNHYNPAQEDVNNDGIGDWSDDYTILTSISEIFKSDTVSFSNNILLSLRKIYNSDRVVSKIEVRNINDSEGHITIDTENKKFYVSKDVSLDFMTKHLYDYKIGVHSKSANGNEVNLDSLDLRIYVDMYKNEKDIVTEKNKLSNNLTEYKLINPYRTYNEDQSFFDKHGDIPSKWGRVDFESNAYYMDLNEDGYKDLIFGDYRVDVFGRFFSIHHLSDPVYLTHDGSFNFKSRYNKESGDKINKSVIHSPQITVLSDLNNNGNNEILNFGEDYHIGYPPHHPHINYIYEWFKTKDLEYGLDYTEFGKKVRYYSISNDGELIDEVDKINISNNVYNGNPNYLRNMYASTAGDIDGDYDNDLLISGNGWVDVLKNDGNGNFFIENQHSKHQHNKSEGHMLIFDIDSDGNNDVIYGGQDENFNDYSIFAFYKGNGTTIDFQNPIVLEEMHPSLGLRSIFYEDINGDDIKELIAYFTVGFGCNGCGLKDNEIPNFIKIYQLTNESNGYVKDISNQFFSDSQNNLNFYSQTSFLQHLDLDGDGYKDLVPKFSLEDPELGWDYPNNAYRGDWNNSKGFQYFKFNNQINKYEIVDLGQFNDLHHYNYFDFFDINNDNSLEWIIFNDHHSEKGLYIYEYFFDLDNDGIFDTNDNCPNTPEGVKVDVNGCEVFTMPVSNFNIKTTSATCIGNSDGLLNLSVEDASVDYTVTITGKDNVTITGDSKTASVSGLAKGTYTVCFKVDGQSSYEQCFDVVVGEPEKLNAFVSVDEDDKKVSITMSGSNVYNVEINGKRTTVSSGSFTTELNTGLSIIKVYTDLECQGSIEQEVFVSEDIHYYPNPTDNDVKVHVGGEDQQVKVSIFTTAGVLVYTQEQTIEDITRKTQIDLSKQQTGTYVVVMESKTVRKTFKIIRE